MGQQQQKKKPQDRIRVYKPAVVGELLQEAMMMAQEEEAALQQRATRSRPRSQDDDDERARRSASASSSRPSSSASSLSSARYPKVDEAVVRAMRERKREEYEAWHDRARRETSRRMAEARKRRERAFMEMYGAVLGGMEGRSDLLNRVSATVRDRDEATRRRTHQRHADWENAVFLPIQAQLSHLDDAARARRDARLGLYEEYLAATRSKAGVFRDIVIEADYDPFKHSAWDLRYARPNAANDPTKRDLLKTAREKRLLTGGGGGEGEDVEGEGGEEGYLRAQAPREMLDARLWSKLGFHSTPHGHLFDEHGNPINLRNNAVRAKSSVVFDQYRVPHGNWYAMAEVPKGKKVFPRRVADVYVPRGKRAITNVPACLDHLAIDAF
eukprot:jgi/Chlat1/8488/Chrsp80S07877